MKTIEEFIAEHGLTMTASPAPENPNMSGDTVKGSQHYHCTIVCGNQGMMTYFSVGPGIVKDWARENGPHVFGKERRDILRVNPRSLAAAEYLDAVRNKYRPDLASVLDCLASDASGIENARDFEDWASDYGYDTDSRSAEQTYNTCRGQARALLKLLGREAYEVLLWETERL